MMKRTMMKRTGWLVLSLLVFPSTSCTPSGLSPNNEHSLLPDATVPDTAHGNAHDNSLAGADAVRPPRYSPRVLLVGLNPVENGANLVDTFFKPALGGQTADQREDFIANEQVAFFKKLSLGGIQYVVAKKIHVTTFPPYRNGFQYSFSKYKNCVLGDPGGLCESQKWQFDAITWVKDNHLCQVANDNMIDEIWLVAPPFLTTWESFLLGPSSGFSLNGAAVKDESCKKHYAIMTPNYDRLDTVYHSYGHRIESTLNHMIDLWKPEDKTRHWVSFSAMDRYGEPYSSNRNYPIAYCGNTHFPSNAVTHYDYGNKRVLSSTCSDWKNFPHYSAKKEPVDCSAWGCSDAGWQGYWFGAIPSEPGTVAMVSTGGVAFQFQRDWWYYILYPDNAIEFVKSVSGG